MSTIWPKEVPILEASDICKYILDGPNDTHCLIGWCNAVFGVDCRVNARRVIEDATGSWNIIEWNDCANRGKFTIANAWNRAMAKLGYVVGNPVAKRSER